MPDRRAVGFVTSFSVFQRRTSLLTHTALATTIMLGGLVLAAPVFAGDVTGGAGIDGLEESSTSFPPELIEVGGAGITVSRVTDPATGDNGGPGNPGTGTAAVNTGESSNGTGGAGGLGGDGTSGGIGALDIILNEDIANALSVTLTTGDATGGNGGAGGVGTGGIGGTGGSGGTGGVGGAAVGQGGSGGTGGDATGGDADVTVTPGGDITVTGEDALSIAATTGDASGGNGGAGGAGTGGTGGTGGVGGGGGGGGSAAGQGGSGNTGGDSTGGDANVTVTSSGDITVTSGNAFSISATTGKATGGNGGAGGAGTAGTAGTGGEGGIGGGGGSAAGQGGSGGTGGDATGGDANVAVTSSGDITVTNGNALLISAATGEATGGNGGAGGAGTGGTGGTGALGGRGGGGGSGAGQGGSGVTGGDATGGDANVTVTRSGDITVTNGNAVSISATTGAATGGNGGAGGAGTGGTGGTGGSGGAGGGGGSAPGQGGSGGMGGAATSGDAIVSLSNGGNVIVTGGNAISITAEAGAATGGNGGAGGAGTGGAAGPGGSGSSNGPAGSADGQGSSGVTGGAATGGDAIVTLSNGGDLTVTGGDAITIIAEAGNATGGNGGAGGEGTGGTALDGGGADGGGAQGGIAEVKVTNDGVIRATGNGIDITATAGAGTGGTGGTGATTGLNGAGTNGSSSIKVDNSSVVDVDGIGVRATAKGDNGTIAINNTGGTITGGLGGVIVQTDLAFVGNGDIDIVNSGLITADNLQAINAKGAATEILNSGTVLGRIDLTAEDDSFDNQAGGIFATRGTSTFGAGADIYNNLAGSILDAADDPGTPEDVQLNGLEQFRNNGLITLVDGAADDRLTLSADAGDVAYSSSGGRLQVDAVLGGQSDFLTINGDVVASLEGPTTPTQVAVNVIGVSGASDIGVIEVTGTTNADDFVLEGGPLNVGFFTWNMRLDEAGHIYELFTSGVGTGAYEFAAGITATQDIWYQTTGTLLQRQADLRPLLAGTQVTPVADFSEPVAPTPVGQIGPGFWIKGVGAWLERDQGDGLSTTDRKQSIYGGLAGFDFATEGAGDAWLFGLYGGYLGSKLTFNETNTEWTYDGPTVGAYATYLNEALYVDLLVKADFLSININPDDIGPGEDDADTDGVNIGGLIDAGYKIGGGEGVFIEPQATLAVLHTEIDDVDIFGGTVEFDDETSVRGRLGLRLGYDHTAANAVVYSSDVTASVWQEFNGGDNEATIVTADFPAFGVSDAPDETVGDISLGFSVAAPEGWSGFARGSYQFADGYDAYSGNLGLRYSW